MLGEEEKHGLFGSANPIITLSSDDESDLEELPTQSSNVSSAGLKLVYDVEYKAPE